MRGLEVWLYDGALMIDGAQGKLTRQLFVYFCQVGGMNRGMGNSAHTATLYDEKPGNSRLFIQPVWAIHTPCITAHTDRVFG